MAETVKTEAPEEINLHEEITPSCQQNQESAFQIPPEDDLTLAQMSISSPLTSPRITPQSVTEKKEKRVKIKRSYITDSKNKHATAGHNGKCICCRQTKPAIDRLTNPGEVKSAAMIRAEEFQSNLESNYPSFIKSLVRSHVGSCFWMGLPGPFCRAHLPRDDTIVTLEDEFGKEFRMKYIGYKTGLSAGWRQFAVSHQLIEGDVLVFQLIGDCRFKVYVIRANDLAEVDGALGLLNLDSQIKQNGTGGTDLGEMGSLPCITVKRKRPRSLSLAVVQKKNKKSSKSKGSAPRTGHIPEQSENDSEEVGSEVLEGYKLSLPGLSFEDVTSYENFNILIDGLALDSELSEEIRRKYYNLCCCQNSFLHENLIRGINFKLIAGIITEIVSIADAIRGCNLTTTREEFTIWDKTLKASEQFGMKVGFLRARLNKIVNLAFESEGAVKTRRYIEARAERAETDNEIRSLEAKLEDLRATKERCASDIENLKSKAEIYEIKFQEEVLAPW